MPPRMSAYTEASKAVFEIFDDTTPLVEGISIDEAFLDVRGLRAARGHARRDRRAAARATCASEVGLPITVGVARTKFLAKVASGVAKPDGLLVVAARRASSTFLHPLPVERLWGVGAATAREAARAAASRRSASSRGSPRAALVPILGQRRGPPPARARAQPRPARRATRPPPAVDRLAARARPAQPVAGGARADARRARRPCDPPRAQRATASGARSCCACASTTSRARRARTRSRGRPRARARCSTSRAALLARRSR